MRPAVKDLINIAVFVVIYEAIRFVFGNLGALTPVGQVLGPFFIPILTGIPFMLFLTRVKRFGLVTIFGVLFGLVVLALPGHSFYTLLFAIVLAPLADLILRAGEFKRWPNMVACYIVIAEIGVAAVVPLFFLRDATIAAMRARKADDPGYVDTIIAMTPPWMFVGMIVMIAAGATIGAFLGRATLRKHFERAGIA